MKYRRPLIYTHVYIYVRGICRRCIFTAARPRKYARNRVDRLAEDIIVSIVAGHVATSRYKTARYVCVGRRCATTERVPLFDLSRTGARA
jgi:hypothetical protein